MAAVRGLKNSSDITGAYADVLDAYGVDNDDKGRETYCEDLNRNPKNVAKILRGQRDI